MLRVLVVVVVSLVATPVHSRHVIKKSEEDVELSAFEKITKDETVVGGVTFPALIGLLALSKQTSHTLRELESQAVGSLGRTFHEDLMNRVIFNVHNSKSEISRDDIESLWTCDPTEATSICSYSGSNEIMNLEKFMDAMDVVAMSPPLDIIAAGSATIAQMQTQATEDPNMATFDQIRIWVNEALPPSSSKERQVLIDSLVTGLSSLQFHPRPQLLQSALTSCDMSSSMLKQRKFLQPGITRSFQEKLKPFGLFLRQLKTLKSTEPDKFIKLVYGVSNVKTCGDGSKSPEVENNVACETMAQDAVAWGQWIDTKNPDDDFDYEPNTLQMDQREFALFVNFFLKDQTATSDKYMSAKSVWSRLSPVQKQLLFVLHDQSSLAGSATSANPSLDACELTIALDSVLNHRLHSKHTDWKDSMRNAFNGFRLSDRETSTVLLKGLSLRAFQAWAKAYRVSKDIVDVGAGKYDFEKLGPAYAQTSSWISDHSYGEMLFQTIGENSGCVTQQQIAKFLKGLKAPSQMGKLIESISKKPETDELKSHKKILENGRDAFTPEKYAHALVAAFRPFEPTQKAGKNSSTACISSQVFMQSLKYKMLPYEGISEQDITDFSQFVEQPSAFSVVGGRRKAAAKCSCYNPNTLQQYAIFRGAECSASAVETDKGCELTCGPESAKITVESCIPSAQDAFTFWAFTSTILRRGLSASRPGGPKAEGSIGIGKVKKLPVFELEYVAPGAPAENAVKQNPNILDVSSLPASMRLPQVASLAWRLYGDMRLRFTAPSLTLKQQLPGDAAHYQPIPESGLTFSGNGISKVVLQVLNTKASTDGDDTAKRGMLRFQSKPYVTWNGKACTERCPLRFSKFTPDALFSDVDYHLEVEYVPPRHRIHSSVAASLVPKELLKMFEDVHSSLGAVEIGSSCWTSAIVKKEKSSFSLQTISCSRENTAVANIRENKPFGSEEELNDVIAGLSVAIQELERSHLDLVFEYDPLFETEGRTKVKIRVA